jgi:selenide,water dikinase
MKENVLVGTDTHDDAAVYRIDDRTGIVATVDVFTPIVDDARTFGRISAANSLSDVYAMGGTPLFALSIVGFPLGALPIEDLGAILAGAGEVAGEAGIGIIGGHSIDDPEPKFGLCVIGRVDVDRVVRNDRLRPGDELVLTKPLGSGIITTGIKRGSAPDDVVAAAIETMVALNRGAGEAMVAAGAVAATDVTGFGLLGHMHEMAHGSGVSVRLDAPAVPLIPGARELAVAGVVPGGTRRNLDYFGRWIDFDAGVDDATRLVLADAQTSGGLLIGIAPADRAALERELAARGVSTVAVIGAVVSGEPGRIRVTG